MSRDTLDTDTRSLARHRKRVPAQRAHNIRVRLDAVLVAETDVASHHAQPFPVEVRAARMLRAHHSRTQQCEQKRKHTTH